jgi:hypothetical protein
MLVKAGIIILIASSVLLYIRNGTTTTTETTAVFFHGNMDKVSVSSSGDVDELEFIGWPELQNHRYVKGIYLNNGGGTSYAFQEIRKDPTDANKSALYAQSIDDDPNVGGTSRAQLSLVFKKGINLPIYHTSHRMYLNPDIGFLTNYPASIHWFTLFEIWNQHQEEWSGDQAGSCRWNLALYKESGAGQPLYWQVEAELMQPNTEKYLWKVSNDSVPIPLGKWFTLDVNMKRGDESNGRFTIKITVDGVTSIICDETNTTIYPGHPEIQVSAFQPFKLYTSDAILDWMRANNKSISAYYNDFTWHKN